MRDKLLIQRKFDALLQHQNLIERPPLCRHHKSVSVQPKETVDVPIERRTRGHGMK